MPASEPIVCVGDNCVDVTQSGRRESPNGDRGAGAAPTAHLAGGNAFNVAVALARMGRRASYVGAVGDDPDAEVIVGAAREAGVDTSRVRRLAGATGRTVVDHDPDGERRFVTEDYGVAADYRIDHETAAWLSAAGWLHFARQVDLADWGSMLRERGALLSCDLGHGGGVGMLESVAPVVDVAFMSASSAAGLTPEQMVHRALDAGASLVVVTLGARGSIAASADTRWQMDAVPVRRVIDTLGAGDAYIAAFIAARVDGKGIEEAMRAGSLAGAAACTQWGPTGPVTTDGVLA
ncbi:MAG TPA: carbohydrate kinase family protein [Solirubrobacteraceae bacterium]|nr:carbohydrate kinase family protein [Solirubrobacteraceae bacterium]